MYYYIGIDVSKQVLNVFDGKRMFTVKNEKGLKELKGCIKRNYRESNNLSIIFEATGPYSNYLKAFCADSKIRAYIMNPKKSANFSKAIGNRSKTDKIDARTLYAFRALIGDKDMKIPEKNKISSTLSSYLSMYEFVLKTKTSISNHTGSLKYQDNVPKVLINKFKEEVRRYDKLKENIVNEAVKLIKSNRELEENYHNLLTIPGIGKIAAIALLSLFTKYEDTNRSEITALVGLDPTRKESGTSVKGKRKISKSGSKIVRKILYFPTMNAIQHNETIRVFYKRLVEEKHKLKKVTLIASMRKLLLIAHAIYKNKTEYSTDYGKC